LTLRVTMAAMVIQELAACDLAGAVGVIARAMRNNPMDVAALGDDPDLRLRRLQRMFAIALPGMLRKGVILGAFDGSTLGGFAAMLPPGCRQPSAFEKMTLAPRLLPALGIRGFSRLGRWLGEWDRHDLNEPHWHLGPIGVDTHLHGRGLGRALVEACCVQIDRAGAAGYLETDKPQNVTFYNKHGFETVGEATILGTRNWFMRRPRKAS
jgi:ribosomal protein S18 acetylase RimI-like enzyme